MTRYFYDPSLVNWSARIAVGLLTLIAMIVPAEAQQPLSDRGQVRVETNDRGTYQSAIIQDTRRASKTADLLRRSANANSDVHQVTYDAVHASEDHWSDADGTYDIVNESVDHGFIGSGVTSRCSGDGCDGNGCDAIGCDAIGCDSFGNNDSCTASSMHFRRGERIVFSRDRWFGSAEALLWFRDGDRLPPLVTTGPTTDQNTAGELGAAGTQTLFGDENTLNDLGVGGRLTIGTWLDEQHCRSIVARVWYGGQTDDGFSANSDNFAVLARPFTNFSDGDSGIQDTQLVNFPSVNQGNLSVDLKSDVYGADFSVRRTWREGWMGSVQTLYGYQYLRLDEDLSISSTTLSTDDQAPIFGGVLSLRDQFDVSNEFHGAQLGLAGDVSEGCWSLNWLAKVGFGSLQRRANLSGSTTTSLGGSTATDNQGLLVRNSNSGVTEDHTFGWVPELGAELSYRRFPNYDLTIGYSIVALTDAIRVSSAIDDDLGSNLSVGGAGVARPSITLDDSTFYIQGIHFGIAKVF